MQVQSVDLLLADKAICYPFEALSFDFVFRQATSQTRKRQIIRASMSRAELLQKRLEMGRV